MSLAGVRARVRHKHDLNAALTAYAEWLWLMVAPKAHPRFHIAVYLTRREGQRKHDGLLTYVQAGRTRLRIDYLRRTANKERLPDRIVIPVNVFTHGVQRGLESFTGTLVHELAHARDVAEYVEARHWYVASDRDEAVEAEDDAYKRINDTQTAERSANRMQTRVMMSLTHSEMWDHAAAFWPALAEAHDL